MIISRAIEKKPPNEVLYSSLFKYFSEIFVPNKSKHVI